MKKMNDRLQGIWQQLELNKAAAFEKMEVDATARSGEGWTPKQTLEHLIISEKSILSYCKKKTLAEFVELPLVTPENEQNSQHLNNRLMSTERYSQPQGMPDPKGDRSIEEYHKVWSNLRYEWEQFLRELPNEYNDRLIFRHPFAGRLSIAQTLEFITNHIAHHYRQLASE